MAFIDRDRSHMSDIKLFRISSAKAIELSSMASDLEKPLQTLIEKNLDEFFGIRFLASEYSTGKTHAGRIDTLGLDEDNCPVIIEYKRSVGENVISQGLYYLDWLMDHQAEYKLLAIDTLGDAAAAKIDWSAPRLLCIAADFTKYDAHAVQQIDRNVELVRYRRFGADQLLFELVSAVTSKAKSTKKKAGAGQADAPVNKKGAAGTKTSPDLISSLPKSQLELLIAMESYILSLGDDVQRKELKLYVAYKRLKNFASIVPQKNALLLHLHLDPATVNPLPKNARDMSKTGHWGTGELQFTIKSLEQFNQAKPYIATAYLGNSTSKV